MIKIVVLKIIDRVKEADLTQDLLTRYSSVIATRLGFHELTDDGCGREACIILHLTGNPEEWNGLIDELGSIGGIEIAETDMSAKGDLIMFPKGKSAFSVMAILVDSQKGMGREVQKVLTSFGCEIRTRLGVNETIFGKPYGLILLEMRPGFEGPEALVRKIDSMDGVKVRLIKV